MPIGFNVTVNLAKIDESKLYTSKKTGDQYLNLTGFISEELDQFGNNVSVHEKQTKEDRDEKNERNYLGNGKVFFTTIDEVPKGEWIEDSPY